MSTPSATDNQSVSEDPFDDSADLETFVDDLMADRIGESIPGATVAIVVGDTPILTKGYGYADADAQVPVRPDETTFRVGSVGKLVTWTAVMQGVERGVLDLDEDVNSYLQNSEVAISENYDNPVTLQNLGTHTAGFESQVDPEIVASPGALEPLETVLANHQPPRIRPPGEAVGYSNYGAALAGHIVAQANDTSFEEYVQSEIFEPLGMTHSTFAQPVPDDHPGDRAAGHTKTRSGFSTSDDVYINMRPAGSMSATATDMARFMSAHLGDGTVGDTQILETETTRTMHSEQFVRHPAVNNWRYGFHGYGDPNTNLMSHSGGTIYFTSRLLLAPDQNVGIFVNFNVNSDSESPSAIVDEIIDEYDLQPNPSPPTPTTAPGKQERVNTVTGEYSGTFFPESGPLQFIDRMAHIRVKSRDNSRLVTTSLGSDAREWVETDPYVYKEVDGHDVLAFEVADGAVEVMNVSSTPQGGYTPVPFHEKQLVTGGVVGVSLSGFALSLLGWGAKGAWQWMGRWRDGDAATEEAGAE